MSSGRSKYNKRNRNCRTRRANYCYPCEIDYQKTPQMESHNRIVHAKNKQLCDNCGTVFLRWSELQIHKANFHPNIQPGQVKCSVCAAVCVIANGICRQCHNNLPAGNHVEQLGEGAEEGLGEGAELELGEGAEEGLGEDAEEEIGEGVDEGAEEGLGEGAEEGLGEDAEEEIGEGVEEEE